jgi:hypothetical protein
MPTLRPVSRAERSSCVGPRSPPLPGRARQALRHICWRVRSSHRRTASGGRGSTLAHATAQTPGRHVDGGDARIRIEVHPEAALGARPPEMTPIATSASVSRTQAPTLRLGLPAARPRTQVRRCSAAGEARSPPIEPPGGFRTPLSAQPPAIPACSPRPPARASLHAARELSGLRALPCGRAQFSPCGRGSTWASGSGSSSARGC